MTIFFQLHPLAKNSPLQCTELVRVYMHVYLGYRNSAVIRIARKADNNINVIIHMLTLKHVFKGAVTLQRMKIAGKTYTHNL